MEGLRNFKEFTESTYLNRMNFTDHAKVWEDVAHFYLLNEKAIVNISSKYLLSCFMLEYLSHLDKLITKRLSNMHGDLLMQLEEDPVVAWIEEGCLPKFVSIIENHEANTLDDIAKLGHIIDLARLDLNVDREIDNIELYDIFYVFVRRLESFC